MNGAGRETAGVGYPIVKRSKLTVIHEMDKPDSKLIGAVSSGWPHLLSSLKSLLETTRPTYIDAN